MNKDKFDKKPSIKSTNRNKAADAPRTPYYEGWA